jgi:transposase InsO family protein
MKAARIQAFKETFANKVVVPESLKAFVIGCHHNLPMHGHQGRKRTEQMIGARYYWKGMSKDIRKWIQACSGCSVRKTPRPMHAGFTEITQSTRPWQTVGIDIVGTLPTTKAGNKWILSIVDHFSRWPIAIAIPDRESATIAQALFDNLISVHGSPEKIVSDQGKEFISKGMEELCKRWGIRKVTTGGYNPTGNAACERFHKYLNASMTILRSKNDPSDWDTYLQAVLFSYRVSVNDATGYSPYYLISGRMPTVPIDLAFPLRHEVYNSKREYVEKITHRLNAAFELAARQQYAAAVDNERRAPVRTTPSFKSGDFLYVWARSSREQHVKKPDGKTTTLPKKWVNPWVGPFEMVRWQGTRYCVLNCGGKEKVFSVDRLSKHQQWDEIHPNTYKWELQAHVLDRERRNLLKGSIGQDLDDEDIEEEDGWIKENPQAGDIVVFNVKASKENPLQFGLGLIKEISIGEKGKIHFQWMGNFKMQESKPFLPCWEDSKKVIYYKNSPQHKSHKGVMGRDTQTKIKIQDAIMIGEKDGILNSINQKIHSKVLNQIKEHLLKAQAEEVQNMTKKSQRRKNE